MTERRWCTVPKIFNLRQAYEKRFSHLCEIHDDAYITRSGYLLKVDFDLAKGIWKLGYPLVAIATFIAIIPISWFWWFRN